MCRKNKLSNQKQLDVERREMCKGIDQIQEEINASNSSTALDGAFRTHGNVAKMLELCAKFLSNNRNKNGYFLFKKLLFYIEQNI